MMISIHSFLSDEAKLVIADTTMFAAATNALTASLLEDAIHDIRAEFEGRVFEEIVWQRLSKKIDEVAEKVQSRLKEVWDGDGYAFLVPTCTFTSTGQFVLEIGTRVRMPLSTRVH